MKIVDLSHTIEENMPVYPGTKPPVISQAYSIGKNGFNESIITFSSHTGTHIDVPSHLLEGGKFLDQFDINSFIGEGIRIDCRNAKKISRTMVVEKVDTFPNAQFILFYTGWDKYWGLDSYFHDFPVPDEDAVEYICSLSLKAVGIDAMSFDPVSDKKLYNHYTFMREEIILVENLCNLGALPDNAFLFGCVPLKIRGLDGFPVRAFGLMNS